MARTGSPCGHMKKTVQVMKRGADGLRGGQNEGMQERHEQDRDNHADESSRVECTSRLSFFTLRGACRVVKSTTVVLLLLLFSFSLFRDSVTEQQQRQKQKEQQRQHNQMQPHYDSFGHLTKRLSNYGVFTTNEPILLITFAAFIIFISRLTISFQQNSSQGFCSKSFETSKILSFDQAKRIF